MRSRPCRLLTVALLLLIAGATAGVGLAPVDCDEDACTPSCGDCLSCAPPAHLAAAPSLSPASTTRPSPHPLGAAPLACPPRAIEHVPLPAIA
jgi:hypothetical protein